MNLPPKRYYTISEVADHFKVSKSLIRYWENQFVFLSPAKLSNGERRFTQENIKQFQIIYHLLKEKRFTIEGAKKELAKNRAELEEKTMLIKRLKNVRKGLIQLLDEIT